MIIMITQISIYLYDMVVNVELVYPHLNMLLSTSNNQHHFTVKLSKINMVVCDVM